MADILHRVGVKAPIDKVYQALTTRDGLAGWWTRETKGDSKVGSLITFRFTKGDVDMGGFDMKVLELQPSQRVVWQVLDGPSEWVGTKVSFELKQEDGWTIVLFEHQGWREPVEFMYHCSTKWATFLLSLRSLVESGTGQPAPADLQISNWH